MYHMSSEDVAYVCCFIIPMDETRLYNNERVTLLTEGFFRLARYAVKGYCG